jgi:hypothetical protein
MLTALLKRVCVGCKCKDSRILELGAALRFSYEQMQRHDDEMAELQQQLDCIDLAIQYHYGEGVHDVWDKALEFQDKMKYAHPDVIETLERCLQK